jgi:hypothetical protein
MDEVPSLADQSTIKTPSLLPPAPEISADRVLAHIKVMNTAGVKYVAGGKPNFMRKGVIGLSIVLFVLVLCELSLTTQTQVVQQLVQTLASGATVLALSAAWLSISFGNHQKLSDLQKKASRSIALLDSELLRFSFAICPYSSKKSALDYISELSYFKNWCVPGGYVVQPINHSVISTIVGSAAESELSEELTQNIVALEVQIERFNRQVGLISGLVTNNFDLSSRLRQKLENVRSDSTEWKQNLSSTETNFINRYFALQAELHIGCIGDEHNGPNLYTTYSTVLEELRLEKQCHTDYRPVLSPIYLMAEYSAIVVAAIGASMVIWSLLVVVCQLFSALI